MEILPRHNRIALKHPANLLLIIREFETLLFLTEANVKSYVQGLIHFLEKNATCIECGEGFKVDLSQCNCDVEEFYPRSALDEMANGSLPPTLKVFGFEFETPNKDFDAVYQMQKRRRASLLRHERMTKVKRDYEPYHLRDMLHQQDYQCYYCKEVLWLGEGDADHKIPVSRGGTDTLDNIAMSCKKCNYLKNNHTEEEFLGMRAMKARSKPKKKQ